MRTLILVAWTLLLAAGIPNEAEPGACLLQHGSSDLKRAALVHEKRQDPASDLGEGEKPASMDPGNDSGEKAKSTKKQDPASDLGNNSPENDSANTPNDNGNNSPENDSANAPNDNDDTANDLAPSRSSNDESDKKEEEKNTPVKEEKHTPVKEKSEEEEKFDKKNEKEKESEKKKETESNNDEQEKTDEDDTKSSLRLELWLPVPIHDLKGSKKGPMPLFLDTLQTELATAANISMERLDMLGVRGEYADEGVLSFFARDVKASLQDGPVVAEETGKSQSIVDVEVLPSTHESDPSPQKVLSVLREQLGDAESALMTGPLKDTLAGAKLVIGAGVSGVTPQDHSGAIHQESRWSPLVIAAMMCLWRLC